MRWPGIPRRRSGGQSTAHRTTRHPKATSDRPSRKSFRQMQPADLRPILHGNHTPHYRGMVPFSIGNTGPVFTRQRQLCSRPVPTLVPAVFHRFRSWLGLVPVFRNEERNQVLRLPVGRRCRGGDWFRLLRSGSGWFGVVPPVPEPAEPVQLRCSGRGPRGPRRWR
jgi:hypothetical protein